MDAREREDLIARYEAGPAEVAAALDGITSAELDARPAPGEWSVREVIHREQYVLSPPVHRVVRA